MKTFLKIVTGLLIFIIVVIMGLNLYFTDERLKQTVMPYVNDAIGREVQVESMSLTFFSTFPQPGLSIQKMSVPGHTPSDTLLYLEEFVAGVELFSLLGNDISISEISLRGPRFTYEVYKDSSTNIDFLLQEEETPAEESEGYSIDIPYFSVSGGQFGYEDQTSNTSVTLRDFNADISLSYADLIHSTVDIQLGGLYAKVNGSGYVNGLPLSLSETSTIDLENETINLENGTFSIRGLALDLTGAISKWSGDAPVIDLQFNSSSDNFGELLSLLPAEYGEQVAGLETKGTLSISGNVTGALGGEKLPLFTADISIKDGYLKNPDLPQPIQNIQLMATASNKALTIEKFEAGAGSNFITASGKLEHPLEKNGVFSLNLQGDVDLSTVNRFYSLKEFDIDQLAGQLNINATAAGRLDKPKEAAFDAGLELTGGLLKYSEVPEPVENINIVAKANQNLITINSLKLNAAQNRLSLQGQIQNPFDEANRAVDLATELDFDLASIKDFYPINEDTSKLSGQLTARATLKGKADQIERAVQSGTVNLKNGFIDYKELGKPIRNLTLRSSLKENVLTINAASFQSGDNDLSLTGTVRNYLSDDRMLDLRLKGNAELAEIQNYYDLQPTIDKLAGTARLDLAVEGQVQEPAQMAFNGSLNINNVNIEGDSLVQPVQDLNGELELTPSVATLASLNFKLGSSDIRLNGKLENYMEYLKEEKSRKTTPHLSGQFQSNYFNMDELINWEETTSNVPVPIELPDLTSSASATIGTLVITGVTMKNLKAKAGTTPKQIELDQASVELFEGKASGSFVWKVPGPNRTNIAFKGKLDGLQAETFFREYQVLGSKSKFHEYITGSFSANVDYYSEIDVYLKPVISTTRMNGNFLMTRSRLKGHPLQQRLAALFKADELRNVALDEWNMNFTIRNSVLTFKNLRLTSGNIGAELEGTQHLVSEKIDYRMKVYLPGRFRNAIASVISSQAVDALTQENGTIMVPLRITGTQSNPNIQPDQQAIRPILKELLKKKAGDALKKLFGNG